MEASREANGVRHVGNEGGRYRGMKEGGREVTRGRHAQREKGVERPRKGGREGEREAVGEA